ncbi:MAG: nicotinate (nicotinamide) nucleotide adenylyltransferase [Candidatus Zixiibacteriota bacterium]
MPNRQKLINPSEGGLWGIMGGAFNPIHLGHLVMANSLMQSLEADGMMFVPSINHPLKNDHNLSSSYEDRFNMVSLAIEGNESFIIEHPPESSPYTFDLVDYLQNKYRLARFFLPIGSDIINEFHQWYKSSEIEQHIRVVIAVRPGFEVKPRLDGLLKGAEIINIPQLKIASRELRHMIKSNISIKYLVPPQVEDYIKKRGLYAE